ncbi:MAG: DNA polymerase III subunit beta [Candidatus Scalinduaceae bacterium]
MKLRCNKEIIKRGILVVESVVSGSSIKPIVQNIRVTAKDNILELSTTDLEVSVSYIIDSIEVEEPGVMVCPEAKIASIIKEWTDDYIEISEKNKICSIKGEDSYFKVLCTDPEEFPAIPQFVDEKYIEVDKAILADMMKKTSFIVLGERSKYGTNGVFLDIKENQAKMVSNDGRRLAEVKRKINNPSGIIKNCIIPIKGINQAIKIITDHDDVVKIKVEEKRVFMKTKNTTLCSQLIEGQYPKYEEVIPSNMDKRATLDKNILYTAVHRGAVMTTNEYKLLKFKFTSEDLELRCTSPDVGESKVRVPIEYSGDELEIGFNPDFILDFLKIVDTEKVKIELKDKNTAGLLKVGNDCLYVIMPTNLSGE